MNEKENQPVDPFATIDLGEFKQKKSKTIDNDIIRVVDKDIIKKAAEQSDFSSRQSAPKKQKLVTKTFSLFQDEIIVINNALKAYLESSSDDDLSSPSNSDVIRAGLHLLSEKSPKEQADLIAKHRGRGRK